ncbi:MAG: aminoacyl-tRNA hydrolase [Gammaproteobacteria bacterium]|nr:aminoacyl-tRNA hydrolase [Gammaproteobacteria bacterium]MCW8959269.1 aminoacyl-tRNA hydrolase [Gammaproteobacteria bacterium]
MSSRIQLVVGLGNPGAKYEPTRHNAGFWFVDALARRHGVTFKSENKFHGEACKLLLDGEEIWLLKPMTFMNKSGQAVAALARFYKIPPEAILIAHDELDLPPGTIRLKKGGGHGGHNGLRDSITQLGNSKDFQRLRIGIGHPGHSSQVTGYVLGKTPADEQRLIEQAIDNALDVMPLAISGETEKAMNQLHTKR